MLMSYQNVGERCPSIFYKEFNELKVKRYKTIKLTKAISVGNGLINKIELSKTKNIV